MPEQLFESIRRLDFSLPPFRRLTWVSDRARSVWEPRIQAIVNTRTRVNAAGVRRDIPGCCRAFRVRLRDEWELTDPVLAQALNTPGAAVESGTVRLRSPGLLNTLLAPLGLLPLDYAPCSFTCPPSLSAARAWVEAARSCGFAGEMDDLEALLSWPAEWSALHGIAETRTPILKMATDTDATAETYRVQLLSDKYPAEGVAGLRFPFPQPSSAKVTDSKGFKEGLSNPIRRLNVLVSERPQTSAAEEPKQSVAPATPGLQFLSRSSRILDETLARLRTRVDVRTLKIDAVFLGNYFNVLRLNDGSTAACMNYFRFKSVEAAAKTRDRLMRLSQEDPLLLEYLDAGAEPDLLRLSLKTCVVSALSQKLLRGSDAFSVTDRFDPSFFPRAESAVVIGFGGYMDYLIHMTETQRIHVSDLWIHQRANSVGRRLELFRTKYPGRSITFSDGSDNVARLADADLVSITGSAFCTGTMDGLLDAARGCKTIIVQGQSAAILPDILFERGVSLLSTSIKPPTLIELADEDPQQFKTLLEGKLPKIYLAPLS